MVKILILILVRHGQTVENASDIVQGHLSGNLSQRGVEQAGKLKAALSNEKIDAIYSSDLSRAVQTAEIAAGAGRPPVIQDARLREQSFGVYEGEPIDNLLEEMKREGVDWSTFHPLGGESRAALGDRARAFLATIRSRHLNESVLVVTHFGVINSLLKTLLPTEFGLEDELIQNCSITVLRISEDGETVPEMINAVDHIASPISG